MSHRGEHLFSFHGHEVAAAARESAAYHREREAWWREEHERAKAEASSAGVEVREFGVTGGTRAELVVDPTLAGRVSESFGKADQHRLRAERFEIEAGAYGTPTNRDGWYKLDPDDVVYFGLGGGERQD